MRAPCVCPEPRSGCGEELGPSPTVRKSGPLRIIMRASGRSLAMNVRWHLPLDAERTAKQGSGFMRWLPFKPLLTWAHVAPILEHARILPTI